MIELNLVGLHTDDEHVVLIGGDGQRYRLPIDDALRAAVRRDRPGLEQSRSESLRPREIQALIRRGLAVAEIAEVHQIPIERVQRYEGPIIAERDYIIARARAITLGFEPGAPTLQDIVIDRLAVRGAEDIAWSATRIHHEPWQIQVGYSIAGVDHLAVWSLDLQASSLQPLDDQAHWLTERHSITEEHAFTKQNNGRSHLRAVSDTDGAALGAFPRVTTGQPGPDRSHADADTAGSGQEQADPDGTESMLAALDAQRGRRIDGEADADLFDHVPEFDPELEDFQDFPGAHTAYSRPHEAVDATILPLVSSASASEPEEEESTPSSTAGSRPRSIQTQAKNRRKSASKRTSVPSWDEIVFGARHDEP